VALHSATLSTMASPVPTKPISAFFKKRKSVGGEEGRPEGSKRAATESRGTAVSPGTTLSPAERDRAAASKRVALIARARKSGIPSKGLIADSWAKVLKTEFDQPYFSKLMAFLATEHERKMKVYPPAEEVFSWSDACHFKDVKVVILGQDPYHGPGEAHGLCFSVKKGVQIPPSLRNMYKELSTDIKGFEPPRHGYLGSWAEQGVLLLNSVLTVRHKSAASHKDQGWEKFTDAVIAAIDKHNTNVVFILWGNYAKKKGAKVDKQKHFVMSGTHPSPLSAMRGFFGCKHFSKANAYLKERGRIPIDWTTVMSS